MAVFYKYEYTQIMKNIHPWVKPEMQPLPFDNTSKATICKSYVIPPSLLSAHYIVHPLFIVHPFCCPPSLLSTFFVVYPLCCPHSLLSTLFVFHPLYWPPPAFLSALFAVHFRLCLLSLMSRWNLKLTSLFWQYFNLDNISICKSYGKCAFSKIETGNLAAVLIYFSSACFLFIPFPCYSSYKRDWWNG